MTYARKRVVFDTSSLVPACLNPDREPAQILRLTALDHDVYISAATFNELASVLARDKFNAWLPLEYRLMWLRLFRESVILVETTTPILACRDPKDDKFLELALAAKADVLVSSDQHLLEMNPFKGLRILQLSEFRDQILGC
ncbi:MAG: putative toxin-antitoxin system toxin component, PIN family [Bacteroidetes bacterium]|nr:putative toxin-antitoxin system toxin component, PIN family [Bacteroidota bacterium]